MLLLIVIASNIYCAIYCSAIYWFVSLVKDSLPEEVIPKDDSQTETKRAKRKKPMTRRRFQPTSDSGRFCDFFITSKVQRISKIYKIIGCAYSIWPIFSWVGWIPRNFKTFIFEPKLSFLRKYQKNDNLGAFPDFYEFSLYMIFKIFRENSHYRNGHFQEILKNHI